METINTRQDGVLEAPEQQPEGVGADERARQLAGEAAVVVEAGSIGAVVMRAAAESSGAKASRAEQVAALQKQISGAVEALVDAGAWKRMLAVAARFHDYSFGNQMLIALQCPEATRVAGYRTWQKLGRQVRKGERGIAILAPMTVVVKT